jgi:hypothetical protein
VVTIPTPDHSFIATVVLFFLQSFSETGSNVDEYKVLVKVIYYWMPFHASVLCVCHPTALQNCRALDVVHTTIAIAFGLSDRSSVPGSA